MKIQNEKQLLAAVAIMYKFHKKSMRTAQNVENFTEYLQVIEAIKAAPQWLKNGDPDPSVKLKSLSLGKVTRMTAQQEIEHTKTYTRNATLKNTAPQETQIMRTKAQSFKSLLVDLFNTKTLLADVQPAIEQSLVTEIIKGDNLSQPTFEEIEITEALSTSDSQLIRLSTAQAGHVAEQNGDDPIQAQNGKPRYARPITQHTVIKSLHTISREAVNDPKADVLADVLTGADEEASELLESELFGGIGSLGGEPELAGINTIYSDLSNTYTESLKNDTTRAPSFYKVALSGVDGSIGNPAPTGENSAVDNLIDLIASLPVKYKSRAKFFMEPAGLSEIMKLKDASGALIFNKDKGLLLGFSVIEIEGFRPADEAGIPVNTNDIRVAFGHLDSAVAVKHVVVSGSMGSEMVVDEFSRDGALTLKGHKTFISYTKASNALRLLAAKS